MKKKQELKKLLYIFDKKQKIKLLGLILILFIETIFELLGVISIYPFIALVLNPEIIQKNVLLQWLYNVSGCNNNNQFFVLVAVLIIILYVIKNMVNAYASHSRFKYVYTTKKEISVKLMNSYMKQPYSFFLKNNSATLMSSISNDITSFFDMILQGSYFFSDGILMLVFGGYLLYLDFALSFVCIVIMFLFVFLFVKQNKKKTSYYGKETQKSNSSMMQWLQQGFGGTKEIKILGREQFFVDQYETHSSNWSRVNQKYMYLNTIPHMVLEVFCSAAILIVIMLRVMKGGDTAAFVPQLATFAMALFRLFPRISRLNISLNTIIFSYPFINKVYDDLKLAETVEIKELSENENASKEGNLTFQNCIELSNASFAYSGADHNVFTELSVKINKGQTVGIVGASGVGKSTLGDIILGLLDLSAGTVLCDGKDIKNHKKEWAEKLGYIPQSIFLSDDTIRNNVGFGLREDEVDDEKIWKAVERAQLMDFVNSLPEKLDTWIGERGVRLSGGQRQRIGIARALYNNPDILVLDEATSALDNETETAVMDAVERLGKDKTMIIIAHRITTLQSCDVIYEVENGKVHEVSYESLLSKIDQES